MPISAYTNYASYLGNVRQFQTLQANLAELQQQFATQKKSGDLSYYGNDASRLLNLRATITQRETYLQNINSVESEVKSYDRIWTRLEEITSSAIASFSSPLTQAPIRQQNIARITGDIGDVGESYRIGIDGRNFSYVTTGLEGSIDEIAANLAQQINAAQIGVSAEAKGEQITLTVDNVGQSAAINATSTNVAGGRTNNLTVELTRTAASASITRSIDNALTELTSLFNERINDRYLFSGQSGDAAAPAVDLNRLTNLINKEVSVDSQITQQLASGTILQQSRVTTDVLGYGQNTTFTVNATNFTFSGPLTAQQLALNAATAIQTAFPGVINVSDIDANGFTLTAAVAGTGFSASISGTDPTLSSLATIQTNVPIGVTQAQQISFSGEVGRIGQIYSITLTEPPVNSSPVTFTYRSNGQEKSIDEITNILVGQITNHQPPYTLTTSNAGNGTINLSSTLSFTAHAAFGIEGTVQTAQRTVEAVAQEEVFTFPGPFGDAGETYGINFTAPVAASFTVTTNAYDNAFSIADQFAQAINANTSLGVTASIRGGQLVLSANQAGTPFTAALAPFTDSNPAIQSLSPYQTQTVANIVPGPLAQIDHVQLSGPLGKAGTNYTIEVNGQTVTYTSDGSESNQDTIAISLAALINAASPAFPVTAVPGSTGSGQIILTATNPGQKINTSIQIEETLFQPNGTATIYNAQQDNLSASRIWERQNATIADGLTIQHGFSANEPAIQRLVASLRYAKDAAQDPDHYGTLIDQARILAREALTGLRTLHGENTAHDALLSATTLSHQTNINLTKDASDRIETIDPSEVAAKLQAAQIQLQALFAATASNSKLSLVNFIA